MNAPHHIGFQILEKAKYHMYYLIYENIYPRLSSYSPKIIYSDTDSIIMSIRIKVRDICKNSSNLAYEDFLKAMGEILNIIDTSNLHKCNPHYSLMKKNICGTLKHEFPLHFIECFIGLSPKTYSIKVSDYQVRRISQLLNAYFQDLYGHSISNVVVNDIEFAIFSIDNQAITPDQFIYHFQKIKFNLEPYYTSKVFYISGLSNPPSSKKYYDNDIYKTIQNKGYKNATFFYIEIDKEFDIYMYPYYVNTEHRPVQNFNIDKMSQYELLNSKSKIAKGLPEYLKSSMTHNDYYEALIGGNQNDSRVNFNIITNEKGVTKTIPITKVSLRLRDIKKFWLTEFEAVSFGSYKIPFIKRKNFDNLDYSESESSDTSGTSDDDDDDINDNSNNSISDTCSDNENNTNNDILELFRNRNLKYDHLFSVNTNDGVNISNSSSSSSNSSSSSKCNKNVNIDNSSRQKKPGKKYKKCSIFINNEAVDDSTNSNASTEIATDLSDFIDDGISEDFENRENNYLYYLKTMKK